MRQFGTNLKQGLQTKLKERKTKCVFFYIIIVTHAPITTSSFTSTLRKLFFPHGDIELLNNKTCQCPESKLEIQKYFRKLLFKTVGNFSSLRI